MIYGSIDTRLFVFTSYRRRARVNHSPVICVGKHNEDTTSSGKDGRTGAAENSTRPNYGAYLGATGEKGGGIFDYFEFR